MDRKQLLKIVELINNRFENITEDEFATYASGEGLYAILEESIDRVLAQNEVISEFWKNHQHTTYDGTPCSDMIDFTIIETCFNNAASNAYRRIIRQRYFATVEQLREVINDLDNDGLRNVGDDNLWSEYAAKLRNLVELL